MRLVDLFPLPILNAEVNGHTSLDIALLTGQRRIAICLYLVGFQASPSLCNHNYLANLGIRESSESICVALSFWAIVN
ncbi:hypothetical protein [Coxiella endosymbiont of Ornithodoros maritimus]|uniref:hypothetical protein n=1 Tax=Coxiella endosymbiont of Ornithodoros maritimus TaxID=1656172 RepID=UPI002264DCFA|nr:hypothetical protein [Coxiella endosymbiont of Ornithodoros maritimus]